MPGKFQQSKYQPGQLVCNDSACQRRRNHPPNLTAAVIEARLRPLGYRGGHVKVYDRVEGIVSMPARGAAAKRSELSVFKKQVQVKREREAFLLWLFRAPPRLTLRSPAKQGLRCGSRRGGNQATDVICGWRPPPTGLRFHSASRPKIRPIYFAQSQPGQTSISLIL